MSFVSVTGEGMHAAPALHAASLIGLYSITQQDIWSRNSRKIISKNKIKFLIFIFKQLM
jgi:hypothetical protein